MNTKKVIKKKIYNYKNFLKYKKKKKKKNKNYKKKKN